MAPQQLTGTVDQLIQARTNNHANTLDMVVAGAANTENITTRFMVPIFSPEYQALAVARGKFTPEALVTELLMPMQANNQLQGMTELVQFIQAVNYKRNNPAAPGTEILPGNVLGDMAVVLPAFDYDADIRRYIRNTLAADLPGLRSAPPRAPDATADAVIAMRDTILAREAADARRANKLLSKKYPLVVDRFVRACNALDETGVSAMYNEDVRQSKKSELRGVIQQRLNARASTIGSMGSVPPVVTKELMELIVNGCYAPDWHEGDNYSAGINPFSCGITTTVELGQNLGNQMMGLDAAQSGGAVVAFSDLQRFNNNKIAVPTDGDSTEEQLKACGLVIEAIQGDVHPHTHEYARWLRDEWPKVKAQLKYGGFDQTSIWTSLLVWMTNMMHLYFREVSRDAGAPLPTYRRIVQKIAAREWVPPPLPTRYLPPVAPGRAAALPPTTPNSGAVPPQAPGGRTPATATTDTRGGLPVLNTNHRNESWITAFEGSSVKLGELRDHSPLIRGNPADTPENHICLSYHLRGKCYTNCRRSGSHRSLDQGERQQMGAMVEAKLA